MSTSRGRPDAQQDVLLIEEEYGYKYWQLPADIDLDAAEKRWATMKGINCLVPVDLIFPGAVEVDSSADGVLAGHVHECDDSWFLGTHGVPEADIFEIEGKSYPTV